MEFALEPSQCLLVRKDSTGELKMIDGKTTPRYTMEDGFSVVPPPTSANLKATLRLVGVDCDECGRSVAEHSATLEHPSLMQQADALFDDIESLIREKMCQEFDASTSTTPGLWKRIEEQYAPILMQITIFRKGL